MDFDPVVLKQWIVRIRPKYVWLGFNSKPNSHVFKRRNFPEPRREKVQKLINALEGTGILIHLHNKRAQEIMKRIEVRGKELRGVKTHSQKLKKKAKSARPRKLSRQM
jgi:ABC-type nitrate/sulfonate/bicarbonate transport system substrate-binding protein